MNEGSVRSCASEALRTDLEEDINCLAKIYQSACEGADGPSGSYVAGNMSFAENDQAHKGF